eukprot:scaffold103437_cov21-Prasinocladus_malaysianus.AAC.1
MLIKGLGHVLTEMAKCQGDVGRWRLRPKLLVAASCPRADYLVGPHSVALEHAGLVAFHIAVTITLDLENPLLANALAACRQLDEVAGWLSCATLAVGSGWASPYSTVLGTCATCSRLAETFVAGC